MGPLKLQSEGSMVSNFTSKSSVQVQLSVRVSLMAESRCEDGAWRKCKPLFDTAMRQLCELLMSKLIGGYHT